MALSAFSEKTHAPTRDELRSVLGTASDAWNTLLSLVRQRIGSLNEVWGFTSASTGWGLRILHGQRVILYMTPQKSHFLFSIVLGEKAVAAARVVRLSASVRKAIEDAPRYAEGRGIRIAVRNSRQLSSLATLAHIKWQN